MIESVGVRPIRGVASVTEALSEGYYIDMYQVHTVIGKDRMMKIKSAYR